MLDLIIDKKGTTWSWVGGGEGAGGRGVEAKNKEKN
jgi:hypothetical protein